MSDSASPARPAFTGRSASLALLATPLLLLGLSPFPSLGQVAPGQSATDRSGAFDVVEATRGSRPSARWEGRRVIRTTCRVIRGAPAVGRRRPSPPASPRSGGGAILADPSAFRRPRTTCSASDRPRVCRASTESSPCHIRRTWGDPWPERPWTWPSPSTPPSERIRPTPPRRCSAAASCPVSRTRWTPRRCRGPGSGCSHGHVRKHAG